MATAMVWLVGGIADAAGAERVAAAGTTASGGGWRASLFVTGPAASDEAFGMRGSTTVGARLSRSLARDVRLTVDVFNVFDLPTRPIDPLAVSRSGAGMGLSESYLFHPAEQRGVRLGISIRF